MWVQQKRSVFGIRRHPPVSTPVSTGDARDPRDARLVAQDGHQPLPMATTDPLSEWPGRVVSSYHSSDHSHFTITSPACNQLSVTVNKLQNTCIFNRIRVWRWWSLALRDAFEVMETRCVRWQGQEGREIGEKGRGRYCSEGCAFEEGELAGCCTQCHGVKWIVTSTFTFCPVMEQ